jgi:hypothetical protein
MKQEDLFHDTMSFERNHWIKRRRSSMEHIIQQLVVNFTEKILEEAERFMTDGIGETTDRMLYLCKTHAVELSSAVLDHMDKALLAEKAQRNSDGLVVHQRAVPRSPLTAIGALPYRRTYFKDMRSGERIYLLDHIVGVRGYERVCAHLSAQLVQRAGSMSYENSSLAVTGGIVSRQTVKNKLMRTAELSYVPKREGKTPEVLHIFADEDHISMQNGKSQCLNIITVSEGTRRVCKGRNELISPMHIQGYKLKPDEHWEYVAALCAEKYDMDKVKRVYIHGDAAEWVKTTGPMYFANAYHVLDGYHLNAYMKKLTSGEVCGQYSSLLWNALRSDDRGDFRCIMKDMMEEICRLNTEGVLQGKARSVREATAYIHRNWDAIQRRLEKGMQGSCTEALVSHVLSERLSRSPMGWSEDGVAQVAMVRVYNANGETIREDQIYDAPRLKDKKVPHCIDRYREIADRQRKELLSKKRDWSIFEKKSSYSLGLVTGTKRAYDSLSKMRSAI